MGLDSSQLIQKIRKIEIKTKGLSREWFTGQYHSAFKGRGMTFSEVREYQYGDDIRNIDWNVTARTDVAYVKVYEEEKELNLTLLIDLSASAFFGSDNITKEAIMTEIAATLAFSAIENNDRVSVVFFTDKIEGVITPGKGRKHVLRIIHDLLHIKPASKKSGIQQALEYFMNLQKKHTTCFLLSDFRDKNYEKAIRIASKKHDLIGIQIFDPKESSIPAMGVVPFQDAESGKLIWLDTDNTEVRRQYQQAFEAQKSYFISIFKKCGCDYISLSTDASYVKELVKFFNKRAK